MKRNYKFLTASVALSTVLVAGGCSDPEENSGDEASEGGDEIVETGEDGTANPQPNESFEGIELSGDGEIPEGLEGAEDPAYGEGDTVTINASHIAGMEGAEGTIVSAFDTNAYSVSYDRSDSSERVENYQWVIDEEIRGGSNEGSYAEGEEVELSTERIEGMYEANAVIEAIEEDATVYMVDFSLTESEDTALNYKWLLEKELSAN
ncbi:DUF1541 domain-containing protein [Jeotgalibacillus sp. ET6]|uniref:YdhK family protein n=1 Tax=Jeotgalibacillus sp. ET6 TaxID=3037260 RepID=UPI002418A176|nr:YdhK family protein [Jeotgalibacillus sp. ET6]MDG5473178.1 DUF1541 domain-containing protein [Jeotgalibacillus sp. ET6]